MIDFLGMNLRIINLLGGHPVILILLVNSTILITAVMFIRWITSKKRHRKINHFGNALLENRKTL